MSWNFICQTNKTDLKRVVFKSIETININDWNDVLKDKNIYLSIPYLRAIEQSMSSKMNFKYILFYSPDNQPLAISVIQLLELEDIGNKYHELICKLGNTLKNKILESLNVHIMVCGNVFSCGENGFLYSKELSSEEAYKNLSIALYEIRKSEKNISLLLLKEFWPTSFHKSDYIKQNSFREFNIDVNMVLKIHHSWKTLDDYLESMTTKFRTKAKGVFKKSAEIETKNLSLEDLQFYKKEIGILYHNVVRKSDFKFGELNEDAFISLKQQLEENYIVKGYFLNNQLVGFSTIFITPTHIDANYIGLNYDFNYEYAIYSKMLYDFVDIAIQYQVKELRLGRTAEEIKSSIGAEPTDMKLYVRHKNTLSNHLLKPIIDSISPSEFEIRNPFKASYNL